MEISDNELERIAEDMGTVVHQLWTEKRAKEKGWHAPVDCPTRPKDDDQPFQVHCQDCHPCMVGWAELPDKDKELDRAYPRVFLNLLRERGFDIVKAKHPLPPVFADLTKALAFDEVKVTQQDLDFAVLQRVYRSTPGTTLFIYKLEGPKDWSHGFFQIFQVIAALRACHLDGKIIVIRGSKG